MKILAADGISPEGIGLLAEYEVDVRDKIAHEELVEIIGDYDALMVRSASKVTKEVLDAGKKLKIIGRGEEVAVDVVVCPLAVGFACNQEAHGVIGRRHLIRFRGR